MDYIEFKACEGEKDILFALEQELPKKVVNAVTEAVKSILLDATDTGTSDGYGDYSRSLKVRQEVEGTDAEADVKIQFTRLAEHSCERGWKLTIKGKVTGGNKEYESEWNETPAGYTCRGEISALVSMMDKVGLTDWTYNTIEKFFEYLRDNLADMEDMNSESVA